MRGALARAAIAAFGTYGKVPYHGVNMPAVAVKVAQTIARPAGVITTEAGRIQARRQRSAIAHQASMRSWQGVEAAVGGEFAPF